MLFVKDTQVPLDSALVLLGTISPRESWPQLKMFMCNLSTLGDDRKNYYFYYY